MTQEQKDLLLKDLCSRLPYKTLISIDGNRYRMEEVCNALIGIDEYKTTIDGCNIEQVKPYLFPLSSMTEEQREEFLNIQKEERKILFDALIEYKYEKYDKIPVIAPYKQIEWLNRNHFDYLGLIPMGLAKDATNLNIY